MNQFVLILALLGQSDAEIQEAAPTKDTRSYYLIGNSLTWDTVPAWMDGDVQWHVDCGKSLPFIHANPDEPCVKT